MTQATAVGSRAVVVVAGTISRARHQQRREPNLTAAITAPTPQNALLSQVDDGAGVRARRRTRVATGRSRQRMPMVTEAASH